MRIIAAIGVVAALAGCGQSRTQLGLKPGVPIDPPDDFPTVEELAGFAWFDGSEAHPRARITSRFVLPDGTGKGDLDPGALDEMATTITYFDGLTIWDSPSGWRQVHVPDRGTLYLGEDGQWKESERFEWPPGGPIPEWEMAGAIAFTILEGGATLVGYERIAGVPTAHLASEDGRDVWLDEHAAVMRMIIDASGGEDPALSMVWDVETLAPELTGALPPH